MKIMPFVTISTAAKLAIIVCCLVGIISPCKAAGDMSTITHDAENKNNQGGQGANEQLPIPVVSQKQTRKLDSPSCTNSPLEVLIGKKLISAKMCEAVAKKPVKFCKKNSIKSHCPRACDACDRYGSADSGATFIFEGAKSNCRWNRKLRATPSTLTQISDWCQKDGIRETCRETCSSFCASDLTSSPSVEPTSFPTSTPSVTPSHHPTSSPSGEPTSSPTSTPSVAPSHQPTAGMSCSEKVKSIIESKFGEFIDGSPQDKALDWLIGDIGNFDCNNPDEIIQRFVLAAFYFSTGGDGWTNKSGWLGGGDECDWNGLTCNDDQALTKIDLPQNNLSGTILEEIYALESLEHIVLWTNNLSGTIPKFFEDMTKLNYINLGTNSLTGTVPDMSGLDSLEVAWYSKNNLTGQITNKFEGLTSLEYVFFYDNALTGNLPDLSVNTKLQRLLLGINQFDGGINPGIFELPQLWDVQLQSNILTGPIPDNFGGSTSLRFILLQDNFLTGSIPDISGNSLQKIEMMKLSQNKMSDPVPDTLCALRSSKPAQFRTLQADCDPPGDAQNECPSDCCTRCFVGKGVP